MKQVDYKDVIGFYKLDPNEANDQLGSDLVSNKFLCKYL